MSRILSLAALTVLELSPVDRVSCAAEAGYGHISLRLLPATPDEPDHDLVGDTPAVRALERRLADTGVRVLDAEIFRLRPETPVAGYEAAIATAARLGAMSLLVAGHDPDEGRMADRFAEFCDLADRYGLSASLEFMPWTEVRDVAQAVRIVERAGRANAAVLVDAFHLSRSGGTPADVARIDRRHLRFMQLCDVPAERPPTMEAVLAEARGERSFPGEGGLDLAGLMRALPADLPVSLEIPTHTLAREVGAVERARRARVAAEALLAGL